MPAKRVFYCVNHPDKTAHGHGLCSNCYGHKLRADNPAYAEDQRARRRKYHHDHLDEQHQKTRDYYVSTAEKRRLKARTRWRQLGDERRWEINMKATYGLSAAEYYAFLDAQGGKCAICRCLPEPKLFVDHCQIRGPKSVRGLLCSRCNTLLGYIERSDPEVLRKALEYASRFEIAAENDGNSRAFA